LLNTLHIVAAATATAPAVDLSALAGPAEVAIGIAVAYLGFDRFRYQKRVKDLAQNLATELARPRDVLKASLDDKKITNDEKGLLTLFWFTEDQTFRNQLKEQIEVLKKNVFWNGICFWLLQALLSWRLDRRIVQVFLVLLCAAELAISWNGYNGGPVWPLLGHRWFETAYFTFIATCYSVPAIGFGASEWMMSLIHGAASSWRDSVMVQLERTASEARLNGQMQ